MRPSNIRVVLIANLLMILTFHIPKSLQKQFLTTLTDHESDSQNKGTINHQFSRIPKN